MPSIHQDLHDFVEFATRRLKSGEAAPASVEELVARWRQDAESTEAVADVRQGLADEVAGKAQSTTEAFADIRRRLGISP